MEKIIINTKRKKEFTNKRNLIFEKMIFLVLIYLFNYTTQQDHSIIKNEDVKIIDEFVKKFYLNKTDSALNNEEIDFFYTLNALIENDDVKNPIFQMINYFNENFEITSISLSSNLILDKILNLAINQEEACKSFCDPNNSICILNFHNYSKIEKNNMLASLNLNAKNDEDVYDLFKFNEKENSFNSDFIKCVCKFGYSTYNYRSEDYEKNKYCNYLQKYSIVAAFLEIAIGFGIGHFYLERFTNGAIKFLAFSFLWSAVYILIVIKEKVSEEFPGFIFTIRHYYINNTITWLVLFIRVWQVLDFILFFFKIWYKDGNGISTI